MISRPRKSAFPTAPTAAAQCPGKSHPKVVDMPTLSRSMFRVGRVASDLLRRLSLFPTLARRDATPTVMTSKSAHADRLSHQDCLSRSVLPPFVSGFRSNDFLYLDSDKISLSLGNFDADSFMRREFSFASLLQTKPDYLGKNRCYCFRIAIMLYTQDWKY